MKIWIHAMCLTLMFAIAGLGIPAFADDHWSDDWKIDVNGRASSGGTISFKMMFEPPEEGVTRDPASIDVPVANKTKDHEIAELIENAMKAVLGDDDFKIGRQWGETVTIKARGKTPDYELTLTNNTVQGIMLEIDD